MGQGRGKVEPGSGVPRAWAGRAGGSRHDIQIVQNVHGQHDG